MIRLNGIKNIIFDFGGVILNIDPQLTIEEFKKMNFRNFENSLELLKKEHFFEKLEKGIINKPDFYKRINSLLIKNVEEIEIETAFNKLLLDFPEKNINIIKKLKTQYRLFLLSNTNAIHYSCYSDSFKNKFGFNLEDLFEKAYYSHEIGMRKPDKKIYEKVLNENNLVPSETVLIDDMIENRKAAEKPGIKVIEIIPNSGLETIFN